MEKHMLSKLVEAMPYCIVFEREHKDFFEISWNKQTRKFTKQLLAQLPNPDVIAYIKSTFEMTPHK